MAVALAAGSNKVARFFAENTHALLGSVMVVVTGPAELGRRIVADLTARKQTLGWPDQSRTTP